MKQEGWNFNKLEKSDSRKSPTPKCCRKIRINTFSGTDTHYATTTLKLPPKGINWINTFLGTDTYEPNALTIEL